VTVKEKCQKRLFHRASIVMSSSGRSNLKTCEKRAAKTADSGWPGHPTHSQVCAGLFAGGRHDARGLLPSVLRVSTNQCAKAHRRIQNIQLRLLKSFANKQHSQNMDKLPYIVSLSLFCNLLKKI